MKIIQLFSLIGVFLVLSFSFSHVQSDANDPTSNGSLDIKRFENADLNLNLEAGFPAKMFFQAGSFWDGASISTMVVDVDSDPLLEIFASGKSLGPYYGFNSDGSKFPGWPTLLRDGVAYGTAGRLVDKETKPQIITNDYYEGVVAYDFLGQALLGWPKIIGGGFLAPITIDVDHDGIDEILVSDLYYLRLLRADGSMFPGQWPTYYQNGNIAGMAAADLDFDGEYEIISLSGPANGIVCMSIYSIYGEKEVQCPQELYGDVRMYPVVGDVDADGELEIVVTSNANGYKIAILNTSGFVEREMQISVYYYGTAPVLADLNGDSFPEIIINTWANLYAFFGNGENVPGWPQIKPTPSGYAALNGSAVGDVDGDQLPEIVTTDPGLLIYNHDGSLLFNKDLGARLDAPAIADIDLDGRNEIIVSGQPWNGRYEFLDALWAFDLGNGPHGAIEWGQYGGGAHHRASYPVPGLTAKSFSPELQVFLPLVKSIRAADNSPGYITGVVHSDGIPVDGLKIELWINEGNTWTIRSTTTSGNGGMYRFDNASALTSEQSYYVVIEPDANYPDLLRLWVSRPLKAVIYGSKIDLGRTNLADIRLLEPVSGYKSFLPIQLLWQPHITNPSYELYALNFFDPVDGNPSVMGIPWKENYGVTLYSPSVFDYGVPFAWQVIAFATDSSYGISREARMLTYLYSEPSLADVNEDNLWTPLTLPFMR